MLNFLKRNSKNERQVVKSEWTRNIWGFSMKQKCLPEMKGNFYFILGQKVKSFLTVEILKLKMLNKCDFIASCLIKPLILIARPAWRRSFQRLKYIALKCKHLPSKVYFLFTGCLIFSLHSIELSSRGGLEVELLLHKLNDSVSVDQSPAWGMHDYMVTMDPLSYVRSGCVLYVCV